MEILPVCVVISLFGVVLGDFPFRNPSLPWNERVDNLVEQLNLTELMLQMAYGGAGPKGGPAPAIPKLGITPYQWNEECLRGAADAGEATAFPQAIGLAAAFSPKLIYEIAEATGVEVRAKHNDYVKKKQYGDHKGLSCFSPVINIMRHPLWGRNQETYGEDPYLTGIYAAHYVTGLQGDNPRYIRANAGCKHFDAYAGPENIPSSRLAFDAEETYGEDPYLSGLYAFHFVKGLQGHHYRYVRANAGCKHFNVHGGPENVPVSRFSFDAKVSDRDWRLTFLPAFRACVRAGSYSLMCSYNSDRPKNEYNTVYKTGGSLIQKVSERDWHLTFLPAFRQCVLGGAYSLMCSFNEINGIPACANKKLLTDILRDRWKFTGYVISDEEAVENLVLFHHYANNSMEAAIDVINAGLNIEITTSRINSYFLTIVDAVKQGKLSESLVRERVKPLFYTRMRLGEFDPDWMNPYLQYNLSLVQSPAHQSLAVDAAMQTFVLLKNSENILPLKKHFNKIAIVGPMADNVQQLYGDYAASVDPKTVKTPLEGLKPLADSVGYAAGCKDNKCTNYDPAGIKLELMGSQLTVICVGTGQELEAEGNDRHSMNLPQNQTQLIKDAIEFSSGSPVILLVFSAGPVNISFADRDPRVVAIMQCFFPAQATGEALLNTLTMRTYDSSPGGRLPYTWYDTEDQVPSMTNYSMEGRTYRYFKGTPLYPFGYGLSYSKFQYLSFTVVPQIEAGLDQFVFGELMNIGTVDAYEVVQVYMSWETTKERMPNLQLVAFDRIFLKAHNAEPFKFTITAEQMAVWTDNGWLVEPGTMKIYVGGQQPGQKRDVGSNIITNTFEIFGKKYLGKY